MTPRDRSTALTRRYLLAWPWMAAAASAAGPLGLTACTASSPGQAASAGGPGALPPNPFDGLYPDGFTLTELSADPIEPLEPPARPTGLEEATLDPAYSTRLYRATDAGDGQGGRMRHEYSRRQAFNAGTSRYLAQDGAGAWHLYDGATFAHLGQVPELIGDCEPIWHATDPALLYFTDRNGGTLWRTYDVEARTTSEVINLKDTAPWPQATSYWTKGEGTTSADGRYLTLMATRYDEGAQTTTAYGLVVVDLIERTVVSTLDAADFPVPGAVPDHVSTSASGDYAVVSWLDGQGGTVAFTRDFSSSRQLTTGSEHSDLAFGPERQDYLVYADYGAGELVAIDLATGQRTPLHTLYPVEGEAYALHISGQAFDRPGWAVVSTYADSADHGQRQPAPTLRAEYRKVWLVELVAGGRALNVAHTRVGDGQQSASGGEDAGSADGAYFAEPQASASRDLSRIIFASDVGGRAVESYIVGLPGGFSG
ncbi:MAG: hypothetical protein Q4E00_10250 [Actinomyces bowdenii]|nr:hypothetical protein [Actinomyces bowdenii]